MNVTLNLTICVLNLSNSDRLIPNKQIFIFKSKAGTFYANRRERQQRFGLSVMFHCTPEQVTDVVSHPIL